MEYLLKKLMIMTAVLFQMIFLRSAQVHGDDKNLMKYLGLELYGNTWIGERDFIAGGRLKLPVGEVRLAFKGDDFNFGLTATNERINKNVPFYLKAGNLSATGIIPKMNSPNIPASASPFSASVSSVYGITTTLPGWSTYSRPVSAFFQGGVKQKNWGTSVAAWFSPDEDKLAFSAIGELRLPSKLNLSLSLALGSFPYKEGGGTSWFLDSPYYPAGSHLCSAMQFSAAFMRWKSFLMAGLNESPFGKSAFWLRGEGRYSGDRIIIAGAAFLNGFEGDFSSFDDGLSDSLLGGPNITSSAKVLDSVFQLKGNLQYKSVIRTKTFPVLVKTGLSAYNSLSLNDESHKAKYGAGLQLIFPFALFQLTALANFDVLWDFSAWKPGNAYFDFDSGTVQLKNILYLNALAPSITLTVTAAPSDDFYDAKLTGKISAVANIPCASNLKLNCSATYSAVRKSLRKSDGGEITHKFSSYVNAVFTWQKIKCTCKVGFEF